MTAWPPPKNAPLRPACSSSHPFDDVDVISGQGGVGLELLRQVPDLARVVVPGRGGGGLIGGISVAIRSRATPQVEVIGIQAEACAPFVASLKRPVSHLAVELNVRTIADGIAVKRPGEITLKLIDEWVDDILLVSEDEVAEAMVFLLERSKLVVEGAGAVGVAALLAGKLSGPARGTTVLVLSGGNVDAGLLAEVARRQETQRGRRMVLQRADPRPPGQRWPAVLSDDRRNRARRLSWTCSTRREAARPAHPGRRRCSWCWRRAGRSTRRRCAPQLGAAATVEVEPGELTAGAGLHQPAALDDPGWRRRPRDATGRRARRPVSVKLDRPRADHR